MNYEDQVAYKPLTNRHNISLVISTGENNDVIVSDVGFFRDEEKKMLEQILGIDLKKLEGSPDAALQIIHEKFAEQIMKKIPYSNKTEKGINLYAEYDHSMKYLMRMIRACQENPKATIRVYIDEKKKKKE